VGLGHIRSYPPESVDRPKDNFAQDTLENIRCFGFEAVKVKVTTPSGPLTALVKVRHPASVGYLMAHGDHQGKLTSTQKITSTILDPDTDLAEGDTAALKTLFLASCNVLDLYDHNNNYVGKPNLDAARLDPADPFRVRKAPGKLWWSKTR